jgi:hypothetical protein
MRPVIRAATAWRDRYTLRAFLLPFGRRHLLLEPSCSRHGIPRCCLPAGGRSCRTVTGFPRSTRPSCVRCRVPPLPRGRGALLAVLPKTASTAASQRPAHLPQKTIHHQGYSSRGFHRGFTSFTLPDFPSPVTSGWITGPWASSRASHPTAQTIRGACQERGRALSTRPELPVTHMTLHSVSSLGTCDLVSQRQMSAVGLLVTGGGGDDLRDHGSYDARGGRTAFP